VHFDCSPSPGDGCFSLPFFLFSLSSFFLFLSSGNQFGVEHKFWDANAEFGGVSLRGLKMLGHCRVWFYFINIKIIIYLYPYSHDFFFWLGVSLNIFLMPNPNSKILINQFN